MKDNKKTVAAIAASLLERQMKTYERVQRFLHSRFMRYLVFLAIIGSVMSVILGSFEGLSTYHGLLYSVTYITSLIFFIEYVLNLCRSGREPQTWPLDSQTPLYVFLLRCRRLHFPAPLHTDLQILEHGTDALHHPSLYFHRIQNHTLFPLNEADYGCR